jgi:aminomethyltransferase
MVDFGGWEMPVQYSGIIEEHKAVRTTAGIFDVSHMGEFEVRGSGVLPYLQNLVTNNVEKIGPGQILYTPMCYPQGGIVDDLLVYCLGFNHYWLVVNAGNKEKDKAWMLEQAQGYDVSLDDLSERTGLIALQGPLAESILSTLTPCDLQLIKYYNFVWAEVDQTRVLISRTGYTGEDGFEIYVEGEETVHLWRALLEAGKEKGLLPAGLGARDTLRFEARLPLYGHELNENTTPLEAGLGFFIDLQKQFNGSAVLVSQKANGLEKKLVGFKMIERGIPRQGYILHKNGINIGEVTSGSYSPTLAENLGLGYIKAAEAVIGNEITVEIRGKEVRAEIIKTPFYLRTKQR